MFNAEAYRNLLLAIADHYAPYPVSAPVGRWAMDLRDRIKLSPDTVTLSELLLAEYIHNCGDDTGVNEWMEPWIATQRLVHLWRRTGRGDDGQNV